MKEIKMWSIIREFLTYLCFLLFLYVIIYSNRDLNSYFQVQHLRKYFSNSNNYEKVCFLLHRSFSLILNKYNLDFNNK